jgi:hypothetical protein
MKRRAPAEKKALSYERDRRNAYGGNDKAARKGIPRRKRSRARAERRNASQMLAPGVVPAHIAADDDLQIEALPVRVPVQWRKTPDRPLGQTVAAALTRRRRAETRATTGPPDGAVAAPTTQRQMPLRAADLQVTGSSSSSSHAPRAGVRISITHTPTGTAVEGEIYDPAGLTRARHRAAKAGLIATLTAELADRITIRRA